MNADLVSVVIPSYNRAYCIATTVDSTLAQTHENLEILIVDDGSSDGTRELIEERYRGEPRVRYIYQPNAGVSAARNHGLRLARGQFIALLDSDDIWLPWKVEAQLRCLEALPGGHIWTDGRHRSGRQLQTAGTTKYTTSYRKFTREQLFRGHARCPRSIRPQTACRTRGSFWATSSADDHGQSQPRPCSCVASVTRRS
jgi:glycosyltransferase involved in cell wall biosynthesis